MSRLLAAAKAYAFNYVQDEAEELECCTCGQKQHDEAIELFAAIAEAEAAPVGAALTERSEFLLPNDLASLQRFYECSSDFDADGHDVRKEDMARLAEIGLVQSKGFGRHQVTSFGDYVLGVMGGCSDFKLPLKTYAEYCEDARIQSQPCEGGE